MKYRETWKSASVLSVLEDQNSRETYITRRKLTGKYTRQKQTNIILIHGCYRGNYGINEVYFLLFSGFCCIGEAPLF